MSCRRFGFTLIELLVVVAIISLLMAILMPSLSKARQSAKNVVCISGLNQLAKSGHIYAADNGDRLPYDSGSGDPWRSQLVSDSGASAGEHYVSDVKRLNGWGRLYAYNYLKPAKVYYCPFTIGSGTLADLNRYWGAVGNGPVEWRTLIGNTGNRHFARTGYALNPYMIPKYSNSGSVAQAMYSQLPSLGESLPPPKQVLAMDLISGAHKHPEPVWNIATMDGAVTAYRNASVQAIEQTPGNSLETNWSLYDQCMNMIVQVPQ